MAPMDDMDCDGCGSRMRWETSHSRCDRCGYIRPCCEGAPVSASCVVPSPVQRIPTDHSGDL
jgi:hypothetical protein